jgi:hypothetical protein
LFARLRHAVILLLLGLGLSVPCAPAMAQAFATVGILQGGAVLVRQSTRYRLAEGAALAEGDIVETAKGSFAQIEYPDGTLLGVGESSQFVIQPRLRGSKIPAGRLYLLSGWVKVHLPAKPDVRFVVVSPDVALEAVTGVLVGRVDPKAYAAFVEAGTARLVQRDGPEATLTLKEGDFAVQRPGSDTVLTSRRMGSDFLSQLPKQFRVSLPARAAKVARRPVALQSLGLVSYADVSAWLHTEWALRIGLSRQWRGRAADKQFRAEVAANLGAHKEWERVLFPERFLPKKPPAPPQPASAPLAAAASPS